MFPRAINKNQCCIWHGLAAICDASFDWGL